MIRFLKIFGTLLGVAVAVLAALVPVMYGFIRLSDYNPICGALFLIFLLVVFLSGLICGVTSLYKKPRTKYVDRAVQRGDDYHRRHIGRK